MASLTSSLIVKLINQVSSPAKQVTSSIKGIGQAFSGLSSKNMLAGLDTAIKRNNEQLAAMRGKLLGAAAVGYGLTRAITGPVQAAMDFESAMADVKKVVDFDNFDDFKKFQNDVLEMTTRIPMAGKELSAIVAEAGQSGIPKAELLKFTEMAAKVGVAFDISAREAGEALAKMKTGLGLSIAETSKLSDAMNHLSNNQASKARDVLDVVRRVGAMGKQFGFRPEQVAAFGSAMVAAGAQSEVASTSFMNMGRALTKGASATKRQRAAYQRLGLDAKKVAIRMQKDAVGTTVDAMERIGKLPAHLRASVVSDLFGDEARALGPLLTNLPLLKNSLKLVASEQEYLGSTEKEYVSRSQTFANAVQIMRNRLNRMAIAIGSVLMPPLAALMDKIAPLVDSFTQWAQAHPELVRNIVIATTALIGFRIATIGIRAAALFAKGGIMELASSFLRIGRFGGKTLTAPFRGFGRAMGIAGNASQRQAKKLLKTRQEAYRSALALQTLARQGKLAGANMKVATANVRASGMALAAAQQAAAQAGVKSTSTFGAMGRGIGNLLNPLRLGKAAFGGIGAALRGMKWLAGGSLFGMVAFAGLEWLSNNWKGLVEFCTSFGDGFMKALGPAKPVVEAISSAFSGIYDWFSKLLGPIDETGEKWRGWGEAAGKAVGSVINLVADLIGGLVSAIGKIKEVLSFDLSGHSKSPEKFRPKNFSLPGPDGYAKGGNFSGGTILVGEEGPELITASRSGYVHTADETRKMLNSNGGGKSVAGGGVATVNLGGMSVSINGVNDPRAIADQVISELQSRLGSALTGIQADLGYTS